MRVRYRLDDGSVAVSEFDSLEYSKDYEQATFYNSSFNFILLYLIFCIVIFKSLYFLTIYYYFNQ